MFSIEICIAAIALLLSWTTWKYFQYPINFPPGPTGLPILGYMPFLTTKPHIKLLEAKKKYGDIFSVNVGKQIFVFLASYKSVKVALVNQATIFSGRPEKWNTLGEDYASGIIFANGESWAELRRFTLSKLRDLGLGKASLEPKIQDEIHYLIEKLQQECKKPINFEQIIRLSITNVICTIIFGHRLGYNDENLKNLLKITVDITNSVGLNKIAAMLPQFLATLLGVTTPRDHSLKLYHAMEKIINDYKSGKIEAHQDSFIEMWFQEIEKVKSKSSNINERQLARVLWDLFIAGSDTSSVTLTWAALYLITYPEIQKKVQQEIDNVIGKERVPSMSDIKNMPYTEATLTEINRFATIAPFGAPHSVSQDTSIENYFIPKTVTVVPYLYAIHRDPEIFPDPDEFKPERFLSNDNRVMRIEEVIPFSIGKRQCLGESLARMELFLFFTTLFQNFTFKAVPGTKINLDCTFGGVLEPICQSIVLIPR